MFKFRKVMTVVVVLMTIFCAVVVAAGNKEKTADLENQMKIEDSDLKVDFAEVQWTDINSTTAATRIVLEGLGYETTSKIVSVPIAFQAISAGDIDVFLGDWEPSMSSITEPLLEKGEIIDYAVNLRGAKYTLAVPSYVAEGGLRDFSDISRYGEELDYKIFGIEPGNDGNLLIQEMIDNDEFGLGDFELIESSEAGMLAEVKAAGQDKDWMVFLGWAPHPMNTVYDIEYLTGGDDFFGPDFGAATVHTITRVGYAEENPNLGRFFSNLTFTLDMEGEIMYAIAEGMTARDAAMAWLKKNPAILDEWLDGVLAVDGREGVPAVKSALGL